MAGKYLLHSISKWCNPSHLSKHWSYFQGLFTDVIGNSVPIFAKKKQKWWSQTKKHATYGPGLRFVFLFYIRTVRFQTRTKVTRVGSAIEMKSDRSEFIFRPVPCKRMPEKKCMETDINSYRSEFVSVGRRSWQVVSEAKNAVSDAVSKLTLPWVKLNWNCRE